MNRYLILFLIINFFLFSCKKEIYGPLQYAQVTIKPEYPATYSSKTAKGVNITITNISDGSVMNATTNENGAVVFDKLLPGVYNISASQELDATQAEALTGINQKIILNAQANNVEIKDGKPLQQILALKGSQTGGLVFKEIYYTASRTPSGGTYFSDQFVELYNNSTDTIYLDSLCISDVHGPSGLINPGTLPTEFRKDMDAFNANVYVSNIWMIRGTGKDHPLAPGKSIVIAQDGVNHKELNATSPVDLSDADWETYNERPDNRDADAPNVPNLERIYFTGGFDWLLTVFGPGLVIYRYHPDKFILVPIPGSTSSTASRYQIPNEYIIDAVEALKDGNSIGFKRINPALDAGFVYADNTYNMQSFRRKTSTIINGRRVLQDTNNSGADFEKLNAPTPKSFN